MATYYSGGMLLPKKKLNGAFTLLIPEKHPSSELGDTHKKKEAVVDNATHISQPWMVYVKGLSLCLG